MVVIQLSDRTRQRGPNLIAIFRLVICVGRVATWDMHDVRRSKSALRSPLETLARDSVKCNAVMIYWTLQPCADVTPC